MRLLALTICLSCLSLFQTATAQETEPVSRLFDFQSDELETVPNGFRVCEGQWAIGGENGIRYLNQTARSSDSVFNVILQRDLLLQDLDVSLRLKSREGIVDQGGGVIWRAKNAQTYYVARYNPLEDSYRVYKVLDGKRSQLGSVKLPGDTEWHTLRVTMQGPEITCYFDGRQAIAVSDNSIRGYGRIGLWSKADAQSMFDDLSVQGPGIVLTPPSPSGETREFSIKNDHPFLGEHPVELWGLRCGNALISDAVTERYIRNFDNMNAHGINLIGVYIQGVNSGFPDNNAGVNGFTRHGKLLPEVGRRLEQLIREADARGMVVMIGVISPYKDQEFYADEDIRTAIEETARFLTSRKLNNVFVNLCDEFNHPTKMDKLLLREPDGFSKKDLLTGWFKAIAPEIEVGVGPHWNTETQDHYPTMDVRIIQKGMPIPETGFVVNIEPIREDDYNNDGIFNQTNVETVFSNCRKYLDAPNAAFMFHSGYLQGITNFSGTAPHAEMGGYGTGPDHRGIRFYYEWVRDNVGRWEYPRHLPSTEFSITPQGK